MRPALIMIEGRNMKLVHTRTDPKMLFDLDANDPLELDQSGR